MAHGQSDVLVQRYEHERDQKLQLISNMMGLAAEEQRDLTEHERSTIKTAQDRVLAINNDIALVSTDLELASSVTDRLRMLGPGLSSNQPLYRSSGQVLYDLLHQSEPEAKARYQRSLMRAAEHMGTDSAVTTATAGDLGGIQIAPVVGAVIDPFPSAMPFATAIGLTPAPNAMHFMRPKITDPNFQTGVAVQALEKGELASKKFDVDADPVALATIGGYLNISQQLLTFVAGSLSLIVTHMNKRLGNGIDRALFGEMDNSTAKVTLSATATAAEILKAIFDASAAVYTTTGELAQWLACGPTGWARLGSLVDAAGRPMFPYLGAANALGTASPTNFNIGPAGLQTIVTPAITDATFWVGNSECIEGYIYRYPLMEAVEPSVLGRQVAVAASFAGYRPYANGAVHLFP